MAGILGRRFRCLALLMVAVAAVATTTQTEAQDQLPCITKLAPCSDYYKNSSFTPSQECCVPLESAFKNDLPCLCAIFTNPALQKQLGINVETGMGLVSHCNITGVPPNACASAAPGPAPKSSSPGKAPSSPSGAAEAGAGAALGAEWKIGLSAFFSLLLFIMA